MDFLKGKTLVHVWLDEFSLDFITHEGQHYSLEGSEGPSHECRVWVESVKGDINHLVGSPIIAVEKSTKQQGGTWSFYSLETKKGLVELWFCGESNEGVGAYCERAVLIDHGKVSEEHVARLKKSNKGQKKSASQ